MRVSSSSPTRVETIMRSRKRPLHAFFIPTMTQAFRGLTEEVTEQRARKNLPDQGQEPARMPPGRVEARSGRCTISKKHRAAKQPS